MKKVIYYISIFTLFVTSACTDLKENPKSFISPENSYGEIATFESILIGCYSKLGNSYATNIWITGGDQATGDNFNFSRYNVPLDNGTTYTSWKSNYDIINNLNTILNNIDKVVEPDENKVNLVKGQAHFLRALSYFYLVRYFGDIPLLLKEIKTYEEANNHIRESQIKVYDSIISDLQKAEETLPDEWAGEPGRASKFAAKSVLAKVYLTMAGAPLKQTEKYALAASKSKEIIDSERFQLEENFIDIMIPIKQDASKGVLFQIPKIAGMGSDFSNNLYTTMSFLDEVTNPGIRIYQNFIKTFPEGPRKDATFYQVTDPTPSAFINKMDEDGKLVNQTVYDLNKDRRYFITPGEYFSFSNKYSYVGSEQGLKTSEESDQNYIVFRYAEILLIYAEAQARSAGVNTEAYNAINMVRKRAYGTEMPLENLSKEEFIDAIILERHYEFAFEAKRWFDVVRLELPMKYEIYGHYDDLSPDIYDAPHPNRYLMPIPLREIELNPKLTQNEGYF